MSDFSETTSQSWFSRIGDAIKGILFGLALFAISFPVLFWNEGRAVKQYRTLKEGAGAVVSVTADKVDPANEGKLVHVSGPATTTETLKDPEFGVQSVALRLVREVEMYQWTEKSERESRKKLGGGEETTTTYSYVPAWSRHPVPSQEFKQPGHDNPPMPVQGSELVSLQATLGAFSLEGSGGMKAGTKEPLPLAADALTLPANLKEKAKVGGTEIYVGADAAKPQVGDLRIKFQVLRPPQPLSIIARQSGKTFDLYPTKAGNPIFIEQAGLVPADQMFARAEAQNATMTWILRLIGFLLMLFGLFLVLRPLQVLADVVPFLGDLVGFGLFFIAAAVAATLSSVTIALAWLFYRPLISIPLLILAGTLAWFVVKKIRERKAAAAQAA